LIIYPKQRLHPSLDIEFLFQSNDPTKKKKKLKETSPPNITKLRNKALDALSYATKYPTVENGFQSNQHVIFALVRDPTERFISSLGQAMGAAGSQMNEMAPILKEACLSNTSKETLSCIARYVQKHGFWIELHFTPQVLDLSFTTLYQDVPVAIISFKHIQAILDHFGSGHVKQRNGTEVRSDDVLKQMTVDDYDEETLRIVCEIYEMDVLMQRTIGLEVPRCDPFIPKG